MNIASMIDQIKAIACAALGKADAANERIDALPLPMVFKGTLGTGGTISTLPTASSSNEGYVYIVITDGTYAGQSAKAGDTFVSDGSEWVLVPSADEPSPIDDSVISTALTWSSDKINTEFNGVKVKSVSWTGDGSNVKTISFPVTPKIILPMSASFEISDSIRYNQLSPFVYGDTFTISSEWLFSNGYGASPSFRPVTITYDGNEMTIKTEIANRSMNRNGVDYTLFYI